MAVFESDGIVVEYEFHGAEQGYPVLVHHGLVGSAHVPHLWCEQGAASGVQLIAVARPGYGNSAPVRMSSIADWTALVLPLLEHLQLERFGVFGVSAGAPYAYAVAASLIDRVDAVAIASGLGVVNEVETVTQYPSAAQRAFAQFAALPEDEVREYWYGSLSGSLEHFASDNPWRQALVESLSHAAAGPGREAYLQQRPWGFELSEVKVPVRLWHSRDDEDVPFGTAEIVTSRLPDSVLIEQAEPGHLPSEATVQEAMDFLAMSSVDA